jgi:hypothetical protein
VGLQEVFSFVTFKITHFLIALQRHSDYSWLKPINVIEAYLNSAHVATLYYVINGVSRFPSTHLSYKPSMCTEQVFVMRDVCLQVNAKHSSAFFNL